jgi:hypothetical protein
MGINLENALFLRNFLATNLKGEHAMTLALVEEFPSDLLELRLADDLPTIAAEMHHAFTSGPWFLSVVRRGCAKWSENRIVAFHGDRKELLDACRCRAEETEELLRGFAPEELVAEVEFNDERFPAVYMADWHIVHLVHHRAKIVGGLIQHGFKGRSFYGPDAAS